MALRQIISIGESKCTKYFYLSNTIFKNNNSIKSNLIQNIRKYTTKHDNRIGIGKAPFDSVLVESAYKSPKTSSLYKSFAFTVAFGTGVFVGVSIWEYEKIRKRYIQTGNPLQWFKNKVNNGQKKVNSWHSDVITWWNNLPDSEKIFIPICALNVVVFGLWRIPQLQSTMLKYFCSNPAAKIVCWPMVLSTFSHTAIFHIFANMYVLHSFTHGAVASLGKEQFLGVYLTAGVLSSFASYLYKTLLKRPGLSLGASGAIMGILAYVCAQYPDTRLNIIFLPMFSFSADTGIKSIMCLDFLGLVLGWRYFDHAAHLGGALFGLFWCYFGSQYLWPKRELFLKHYHNFRTKPSK